MYVAKHHVRVDGKMYVPGEVIEADSNAKWHLKVGAIEEIAPSAPFAADPGAGDAGIDGDENTLEMIRDNYAAQLDDLGYTPSGDPKGGAEDSEDDAEIDTEAEPEVIDVTAGIVTETAEEKPKRGSGKGGRKK